MNSIVKEASKKNIIGEEDDKETEDELKKNIDKNVQLGHDALNEQESVSSSHESEENKKFYKI